MFIVMELCTGGSLEDALKQGDCTLSDRQAWVLEVASALHYLHTRNPPVMHRDLKPGNVLLGQDRVARICDFGLSKASRDDQELTTGIGTFAYMAPELILRCD